MFNAFSQEMKRKYGMYFELKRKNKNSLSSIFSSDYISYRKRLKNLRAVYTEEKPFARDYPLNLKVFEKVEKIEAWSILDLDLPNDPNTKALILRYINYKNLVLKGARILFNEKSAKIEIRGVSDAHNCGFSTTIFTAPYFNVGHRIMETHDDILYIIQNSEVLNKEDILNLF